MSDFSKEAPFFFLRNRLAPDDVKACLAFARDVYPKLTWQSLERQGGCSWTLLGRGGSEGDSGGDGVGGLGVCRDGSHNDQRDGGEGVREGDEAVLVQFRLGKHAVSMGVMKEASRIFSPLVPWMRELGSIRVGEDERMGLQVLEMEFVPDVVRLSDVLPREKALDPRTFKRCQGLVRDLTLYFARAWDGGHMATSSAVRECHGRVGKSMVSRLRKLEKDLPVQALGEKARRTRQAVEDGLLDVVPIGVNHGDFLPSNLLVDPRSWAIKGYIDWAEAEVLPSGICLYGLEHMLGYVEDADGNGKRGKPRFVYYDQAEELRRIFWEEFEQLVPAVGRTDVRKALDLSRDVGILLWKGFAWDDGAINRVINLEDDLEEAACLEAWLILGYDFDRRDSFIS
ncbi:hypothetical protein D0869_12673 [Hortaea werneckii]|uniref:Aminoglycoside phosphotransferase domain-containing protein n=1 Tax=Hortaea werneckii TaxID=91943 RepID=A0A3M6W7B0_HORWE|nr:hypothetical protein D0869_12673 [Hortaea werneckii]RMX91908.1 hypothetical protein D0867_14779 [Hortaea werneckii]RMX93943.1 hypothetical protein D0868_12563 [Hortaea werneckii]RMY08873.1 hypothetical protein D0866_14702 [Hortaea werneckii]